MEYSPPPLFKQGASARAKVVFFALVSIVLLIVDARFNALNAIRQVVGTGLYPLQMAVLVPRDAALKAGTYFVSLSTIQTENETLKRQRIEDAQTLQQASQYLAENTQLRSLLQMRDRLEAPSIAAEILYGARDAFTRKVLLDRGTQHRVAAGQPVLDDTGVVGQVTRVFPFTAEVTLLTDKDQAIPVQVLRNGLRSVAYGRGNGGLLDLRFVPGGADIRKGDMLITSGVDGVYPAGLSVAQVVDVEHKATDAFATITCLPASGIGRDKHLLVLLTETTLPPQLLMQEERGRDKAAKKALADAAGSTATTPAAAVATGAPVAAEAPKAAATPPAKSGTPEKAGTSEKTGTSAKAGTPAKAGKAAAPVKAAKTEKAAVPEKAESLEKPASRNAAVPKTKPEAGTPSKPQKTETTKKIKPAEREKTAEKPAATGTPALSTNRPSSDGAAQ